MAILIKPAAQPAEAWLNAFAPIAPDLEIRVWPDVGDPADIDVALVANLPAGTLATLPNLRLIISIPVGLDHLMTDPDLPKHIPIRNCLLPTGDQMMTEFSLLHVLRHHRQLPAYAAQQSRAEWRKLPQPSTAERTVGVIGLGGIGGPAAKALADFGFAVAGWSRSRHDIPSVKSFAGKEEFAAFLERTQILLSLIPSTPETARLLDARAFERLPQGAAVINLSRGAVLVEHDLLDALDSDHLSAATLDVMDIEPLPPESRLWRHPRVTITPHVGSVVHANTAAPWVVELIRRAKAGEPVKSLVR